MPIAEALEKCVDEIIAILFAVVFLAVSGVLALTGNVDMLKSYASVVAPFIASIIAFYFGKRAGQEATEQVTQERRAREQAE